MEAIQQEYEVVRIDGDFDPVREHPDNPNRGDELSIAESIDYNGWYGAVVAQKSTGYILAGNHRYRVAKELGAKEIPVIWKDVDDEAALRIMLSDNQTARRADPDEEKLTAMLQSLPDLGGTGFDSALSPLERAIESGKETLTNGTPRDLTPGPKVGDKATDPETGLVYEVEKAPGSDAPSHVPEPPDPDNVPDDVYTPEYGVIIVCKTEEDQQSVYDLCRKTFGEQDITVRLTAV